jgi:hypothetical protein
MKQIKYQTGKRSLKTTMKWLCAAVFMLNFSLFVSSCSSDDDPHFTVTADDYPRILSTDIPEGEGGQPATLMSIERTERFTYSVIVTPVHHTTVKWYIDNVEVAVGDSIDVAVLAGDHTVTIVATTDKGLQTSRTCKLVVRPCAGDPVPGNKQKERLVKPGTQVTLHGKDMAAVKQVTIGNRTIDCSYTDNDYVEYTVPADLAEGTYPMTLIDATGFVYGAGFITLSQNPVYTSEETVLWEGSFNVTWDTPFKALKDTAAKLVKAGTILRVYVEGNGQGSVTTSWWNNILTGKGDPERGDIMISGSQVLEYVLTDYSMELLAAQGGMFIVGNGYTIIRVTAE